jgi:hypothetical protein
MLLTDIATLFGRARRHNNKPRSADLLTPTSKHTAWVLIFIIVGLDHRLAFISLKIAIQTTQEANYVADAAAIYTFARSFGMCIGVGIGAIVLQNKLMNHLGNQQLRTFDCQERR